MVKNSLRKIKHRLIRYDPHFRDMLGRMGIFMNKNDRRVHSILGAAHGRDAVVIGMGPSFLPEDLNRFKGYATFACNKIFLLADSLTWRPDFYAVVDALVAKNDQNEILSYNGTRKFIDPHIRSEFSDLNDVGVLPMDRIRSFRESPRPFNASPFTGIISGGGTVLLTLIQMAYWSGAKNIYLVGVDFSFNGGRLTGERLKCGDEVLESEGEVNHFHPGYRKPGETWTVPKYDEQAQAFAYARDALALDGVRLINASRRTKLDVLERVSFEKQFPEV